MMARGTVDYEQQFKDDLERAQALSLESLALEKFKNQKLMQDLNISSNSISKPMRSVSRASSMTETDSNRSDRLVVKSRPRPGAISNSQTPSLIAPPPISARRNSTATPPILDASTPDLISFTSPDTSQELLQFCRQIYSNKANSHVQQQQNHYNYQTASTATVNYNQFPSAPPPIGWNHNALMGGQFTQGGAASGLAKPLFSNNHHQPSNTIPEERLRNLPALPPKRQPQVKLMNAKPRLQSNVAAGGALSQTSRRQLMVTEGATAAAAVGYGNINNGGNLIDLTPTGTEEGSAGVRVSILEAFDPLSSNNTEYDSIARSLTPDYSLDDKASICDSIYEEYDPYDFIYSGSGSNSLSDPMYAAVVKSENAPISPPPPLPPRAHSTMERKTSWIKKTSLLFETVTTIDKRKPKHDGDLKAFHQMVQKLRNDFKFDSPNTNMGLVVSPMMEYQYRDGTSIKLSVYPHFEGADTQRPFSFTCDVTSSVQHITLQLTFGLEAPIADQYTLKVWGYNEYLVPSTLLSQYEYVHQCLKLEEDVVLILIPDRMVDKSLRRTKQDDNCDREIRLEDIIPGEPNSPITCDNLRILLETFEKEVDKITAAATEAENNRGGSIQPSGVLQSTKLVVQLMGSLETIEITQALSAFKDVYSKHCANDRIEIWKGLSADIANSCGKIRDALKSLIQMYSHAFRVDFDVSDGEERISSCSVPDVTDTILAKVCAIYRPSPDWNYDNYLIAAQIYHGTRPVGHPELSQPCEITNNMYPRILFDCWLDMQMPVCALAREARLVLVIYGRTLAQSNEKDSDKEPMPQYKQEEVGWASVQFFDYNNMMAQGNILLSIWPKESSHIYGPAPSPGTYPFAEHPVLGVQLMGPTRTIFPPTPDTSRALTGFDFSSLDDQTQQQLLALFDQDMLYKCPPELREVLWDKRHYLYEHPRALPKVLLASHSWEWARLADLHGMLKHWKPMRPIEAIQLLLPTFPDTEVRRLAVKWIGPISSDELVDYLPQLVVALRHETFENSPLARFLLERALKSPRVAHHLFWLLSHNLPGTMPQNYGFDAVDRDAIEISEIRHHRRLLLMLRALLAICGEALRNCFLSQQFLVRELHEIAVGVQRTKESVRMSLLANSLRNVHQMLEDNPTSLPLSPTLRVCGINVASCSYFPSYTLPLKISFLAKDGSTIPAIFKVGDELQQDMLTLQMVRLMDKLWLKEGLDLKMVAYTCIPTGKKRGMIEMVSKAETLRKIQVEHGLTGSFKDKPIAEWLAKHNPSELEYGRAVENFTASCAGYCVVTYILGICDRHNDNIMLKTSGHLFHIDFGKFLGDAQMFGNFKRDRTPFVLTSDMAYVINGGDRPSEKFHKFVDLCCQAFNIVRNNDNLFLHLFTLMASSGMKGVTTEAVSNLHKALLPGQSNPEAAAYFARLIESSLKSWFTQFNFFLHNLAQLKFTGDQGDGETLSFVPKTYTLETDGKLSHVQVVGYQKRYDPHKYYVYVLRVTRHDQTQPMELLRTYKEFFELHQKLCMNFPLAKLHSLSTGLHVGRSNIKQVAKKRSDDIALFLASLFRTADEISHSDLVYTFFHPLLRDQADQFCRKSKDGGRLEERKDMGRLKGQLKLSIHFTRGVFSVMVHHVRSLPLVGNAQEPSTYVKVYLLPDPTKETKRKTKVVKKNCHPSFMEMLEYRMTLDLISNRTLTATVWNYDALQENEFLGGIELELSEFDLTKEMTEWFPLVNVRR